MAQKLANVLETTRKNARIAFSKSLGCWARTKSNGIRKRLSGITALIPRALFGNVTILRLRRQRGFARGVSSRARGKRFDAAIEAHIAGHTSQAPEVERFVGDVERIIHGTFVAAQVPVWTDTLLYEVPSSGLRDICTAADVVVAAPPLATGGRPRLLVVELKTGAVGPALDNPAGPFRRLKRPLSELPGLPERTELVSKREEHRIQAAVTAELFRRSYVKVSEKFDVQAWLCYVDRTAATPKEWLTGSGSSGRSTSARQSWRTCCDWTRADSATSRVASQISVLQAAPRTGKHTNLLRP